MTTIYREWLPEGALTTARVSSACNAVLNTWQERWFAAGAGRLTLKESPEDRPKRTGWTLAYEAADLSLALNEPARKALHQALLGTLPDGVDISQIDQEVIRGLEKAAIDDLGARLSYLADGQPHGATSHLSFEIQTSGASILKLAVGMNWLVKLVRADMTVATGYPRRAMIPLKSALERCQVSIEADLGSAEIEMKELADLVVGDVIVLDCGVGKPIDLRHVDSQVTVVHGVLTDASGCNAIRIAN